MNSTELQKEFNEATQLIAEKKFPEAHEKLLALRSKNVTSPDLESNLGRALVEAGHYGHGTWHYMVAIRLDRFNSEHRRDLAIAQARVEGGIALPMKDPSEWAYAFSSYLRPGESLSLGSMLLLTLGFLKIYQKLQKKTAIILGVLAGLFIVAAAFGMLGRNVVIVASDANLREAPLESSQVTQPAKGGARARRIRTSGDFSEIERTGSLRGWINSKDLLSAP